MWKDYRTQGVVVLGIDTRENGDQAANARRFRDKHALTYAILLDAGNKVADRYGVTGIPITLVIDRKGIVRQTELGFNPISLDQAVRQAVSGG